MSATPPDVPCLSYAQIRPLLQSGDILLCSGTSPMSKMIREATDSLWSHIGLLWRADLIERILVLEAVESVGISPVALSYYINDYRFSGTGYPGRVYVARDTRFQTLTPPEVIRFFQKAADLFRKDYDKTMIALIAWRLMCEKLGLPVAPRTDDDAYICSEYIFEPYKSVHWDVPTRSRGFIAPSDYAACNDIDILWEIATEHPC